MTEILIFHSEDFSATASDSLKKALISLLDKEDNCIVCAAGDNDDEVFYLLQILKNLYPFSFFSFFPSSYDIVDRLTAENKFDRYGLGFIEFDIDLLHKAVKNPKHKRDESLLETADIIFYKNGCSFNTNNIKRKFRVKPSAIFIPI